METLWIPNQTGFFFTLLVKPKKLAIPTFKCTSIQTLPQTRWSTPYVAGEKTEATKWTLCYWLNKQWVCCVLTCIRQRLPLEGGKVSVKLSSLESWLHNTALRHGRLVWNIPESSQPPSSLTWMRALTSEMGRFTPIFATHLHCPIHVHIHSHRPWIPATSKWHFVCHQKS